MRKSVLLVSSLALIFLFGLNKDTKAQGMFVPSAYGAWGNTVYGGMSLVAPGLYGADEDGLDGHMALGFGLGNPVKNFGLQSQINRYAVIYGDRWSFSLQAHRYLGKGVQLALGADNFVRWGGNRVAYSPASYYLSVSQKLKYLKPASSFASRLSYTLGIGTGRFGSLSAYERTSDMGIKYYKNKRSASLFYGALSVDIMKWLDATVEWNGRNLDAGLGLNFKVWKFPTRIIAGYTDLTGFTGDGARFFAGLGTAYQFKDVKFIEFDTKELEDKIQKCHDDLMGKADELKKDHEQILANQKAMQDRLDNLEKQVQDVQKTQQAVYGDDPNAMNSGLVKGGSNLTDQGTGNYVVVYSRRSLEGAQKVMSDLKGKGVDSQMTQNKIKSWYHVYTHLYSPADHKAALEKSSEQRRNGYVGAWVLVK